MSSTLKKNYLLLKALAIMSKRQRVATLATCPNGLIIALCELIDNILRGTLKLNHTDRDRLHKYRRILREIADRKISIKKKRIQLVQTGGAFLPILIPAITAIAGLVADLVRKK